jgi:choline dehydrogenase-like flavoprotein
MNGRRTATLRKVVAALAPPDARIERVTQYASRAIDGLTPRRRSELGQLLDLLWLPMQAGEAGSASLLRFLEVAPIAKLRTGFAALKQLSLFLSYAESEPGSENPTWLRIGYPGPRRDAGALAAALPLRIAQDGERIRADVVVIGSGAGGGVVASAFARAGRRVIVLEAGGAYDARGFTQREIMTSELYLDNALTASRDLGITILAGATVGGGTTVNWCTSLRLPERIADEWATHSGIAGLGAELAPHYAAIERRLEIGPTERHNANNRTILEGARNLGVHAEATPRNAPADCGEGCGYCGFGCAYGKKGSTASVLLPDVAAHDGAIYANALALRIETSGARARSVVVRQAAAANEVRTFAVEAGLVVVAAGALRTPGILARSGIAHAVLGTRLFLHPVAACVSEFDRPVAPWSGPMQSAYSDAFNYRSANYGVKVEVAPTHPGLAALALPWGSRATHAQLMERLPNAATMLALTRDRDPGAIDLDDEAAIRYRVSAYDGANMLAGLAGLFDLAFAAGALRVTTLHARPIEVQRAQWTAKYREAFERRLARVGLAPNRQTLFSAHQMGTAPMGADRQRSVVDPVGRVWGYENLLVADASLFPQSSGVNPMLTIMALASRVAAAHGGAPLSP